MEYNPYAPTTTVLSDGSVAADHSGDVELASRWRRLANMLIDTIGATIASVVVAFVVAVADSVLDTHMLASAADVDGLGAWVLYYLE
jgi:hypothetical protein